MTRPCPAVHATLLFLGLFPFLGSSCVTTEPVAVPPSVNIIGELPEKPAGSAPRGFLGLQVGAHESDSLEKLEVLPGVRVVAVADGGPAAAAGLAAGDIILSADGVATDHADGFEALALDLPPGHVLGLEVRRGTAAFEAKVMVAPPASAAAPVELYRVDPVKLRAGFRSVVEEGGAGRHGAAEVMRLFPGSPLAAAGIAPGDRVVALDGKEITSAADLVRRILDDHEFGQWVDLAIIAGGGRGAALRTVRVRLWAPQRRITRLLVPILFNYEWRASPRKSRWAILDLWLISLLESRREEGERELRILSFFRFRTGHGELVEEAVPTPLPPAPPGEEK